MEGLSLDTEYSSTISLLPEAVDSTLIAARGSGLVLVSLLAPRTKLRCVWHRLSAHLCVAGLALKAEVSGTKPVRL